MNNQIWMPVPTWHLIVYAAGKLGISMRRKKRGPKLPKSRRSEYRNYFEKIRLQGGEAFKDADYRRALKQSMITPRRYAVRKSREEAKEVKRLQRTNDKLRAQVQNLTQTNETLDHNDRFGNLCC